MNEGIYSYVSPHEVEDIVPQNPCENESHIAKLSASENKNEMCGSTKCEVESINNILESLSSLLSNGILTEYFRLYVNEI